MFQLKILLPKLAKHYKIIVFFITALNTMLSHLISLLPISTRNAAIGSVTVLVWCLSMYMLVSLLVTVVELCLTRKETKEVGHKPLIILKGIKAMSSFIGGLFYYFADNVPIFVYKHSETFGCDRRCENKFATVGIVFGITALLFYTAIPILTKRWMKIYMLAVNTDNNNSSKNKTKKKVEKFEAVCKMTTETLVQIVTLDTWLTPIANLSLQSPEFCPQREILAAWVAYVIYLVLWTVIFFSDAFKAILSIKNNDDNRKNNAYVGLVIIFMLLLWLSSALFPLVNNQQPLGCATHCDFSVKNETINDINCKEASNHGIQFSFLVLIEIITVLMLTVLIINFFIKHRATYKAQQQTTSNGDPDLDNEMKDNASSIEYKRSDKDQPNCNKSDNVDVAEL